MKQNKTSSATMPTRTEPISTTILILQYTLCSLFYRYLYKSTSMNAAINSFSMRLNFFSITCIQLSQQHLIELIWVKHALLFIWWFLYRSRLFSQVLVTYCVYRMSKKMVKTFKQEKVMEHYNLFVIIYG